MNYLRDRDADSFSRGLAWVWAETTVLHPFRDMNTRSQFVFFNQLTRAAGWAIDWDEIDPRLFAHARTVAIASDEAGIDALLYPALRTPAEIEAEDGENEPAQDTATTPRVRVGGRSRDELEDELRAAIRHRAANA